MRKRVVVAVMAALVVLGSLAFAQSEATLLLRSGERVTGVLEDIQNRYVYLNGDEERRIPLDQVVLIDFTGRTRRLPETELSATRDNRDLVLLAGGRSLSGRLIDVRGALDRVRAGPLQFVFRTETGDERVIPAGRVSRIYLGAFPDDLRSAVGTTGYGSYGGYGSQSLSGNYLRRVTVPAHSRWVDTGIDVLVGDRVYFESSGEIRLSDDPGDIAGVAGSKRQRLAVESSLPQSFAGALIGRIGEHAFGIGDQTSVDMPLSGRLLLGVNDDVMNDNVGSFTVVIRSIERRRR